MFRGSLPRDHFCNFHRYIDHCYSLHGQSSLRSDVRLKCGTKHPRNVVAKVAHQEGSRKWLSSGGGRENGTHRPVARCFAECSKLYAIFRGFDPSLKPIFAFLRTQTEEQESVSGGPLESRSVFFRAFEMNKRRKFIILRRRCHPFLYNE